MWRSNLKTEQNLQLLPCLLNFANVSKTVSFIFENNSLELRLSKLTSVLEWNVAFLNITLRPFRPTFSIIHETINLTLYCRLLMKMFVIDCLALTKYISGPNLSCPSIRYCIANFLNADFYSFNWNEVYLLLYRYLNRFLNGSRTSSTTFGFGGV